MSKLSEQSTGNQRSEAGMFYPTGYLVVGFDHEGDATAAHDYLSNAGFQADDLTIVPAEQMREAAEARARQALAHLPVRYAVKYRHLVIEDMRSQIVSTQPHSDAARGA